MLDIPSQDNYLVILASKHYGEGNDELGSILMKSFLSTLADQELKPERMLLYNTGVLLAVEGSDTLEDLKSIEEAGCEILSCGTCLNYFDVKDKLAVGEVSNMKTILETARSYSHVLRP